MFDQLGYALGRVLPLGLGKFFCTRINRSAQTRPKAEDLRIEVIGFFESAIGVGEAARLCAIELASRGFKVRTLSLEHAFMKKSEIDWTFENTLKADEQPNLRIYHINPDRLPWAIIKATGRKKFSESYNMGYCAWELSEVPQSWSNALGFMNEILTPSSFSAQAIQKSGKAALVTIIPHMIVDDFPAQPMRKQLGVPQDGFLISTIFRPDSSLERKNPMALIAAFLKAFTDQDNAWLVLKTRCKDDKDAYSRIADLCASCKNIKIVDDVWTREQINGLMKDSNIYASLHRSEGYGLTLAEARKIGTPVMTTGWSGNMDFCTEEDTILVNYTLCPVRSTHPAFRDMKWCNWAEVNTDQAAELLKKFYRDRLALEQYRNKGLTVKYAPLSTYLSG